MLVIVHRAADGGVPQILGPAKPGCSPAQTRAVITRFVTAFNVGNRKALNEAWVNKLSFKWYGVTSPPGVRAIQAAVQRSTLLSYFAERHAAHERLRLTKVKVNGVTAGAYGNFEFELLRSADDLPDGPTALPRQGRGTVLDRTADGLVDGRSGLADVDELLR